MKRDEFIRILNEGLLGFYPQDKSAFNDFLAELSEEDRELKGVDNNGSYEHGCNLQEVT